VHVQENMPKQRSDTKVVGKGGKGGSVPPAKRHLKNKPGREGVSHPAYRRLARRASVKRMGDSSYDQLDTVTEGFLTGIVKHCLTMINYRETKTIGRTEVAEAYKIHTGRTFAGLPEHGGAKAKFMPRKAKKTVPTDAAAATE
jgi:histone H3/H4